MGDANRSGLNPKPQPKRRHSRHRPKPHSGPAPQASDQAPLDPPRPGPSQPRPAPLQGPNNANPTRQPYPAQSQTRRNKHRPPNPQQPAFGCSLCGFTDSAGWTAVSADSGPMAARQLLSPGAMLKVFSYNTWSSSPTHSPFQTHSLLRTLGHVSRDGAGVIALQEVTPELGALVRAEDWVKRDWLITSDKDYLNAAGEPPKGGHGTGSYRGGVKPKPGGKEAVMLMVKRSLVGQGSGVSIARLPVPRDDRGRALLTFDLHQNNKLILRLCTSHFTALPLNAPFRKRQYDQTIQALLAHPRAPVHLILADTNASVEHELTPFHPFTDAFLVSPACPPPPPGFSTGRASAQDVRLYQERLFAAGPTFGHLYPWVPGAPRKKPRKPRRIDRVWVNGAAEVVAYGERGGQEPVRESEGGGRMRDGEGRDGWMWESDHVGVEVTLRITGRAAP